MINSGTAAAADWVVTLTVPGAETVTVTSGDVAVSQSGAGLTFRLSAALPAAGRASFSFTLDPAPVEPPGGCAINGAACT